MKPISWRAQLGAVGLFLIPTFLLVLVIRKSEAAYTRYSQVLLVLNLTAPIGLVTLIPAVSRMNMFSVVGFADRHCVVYVQPVICALWPGEAPDFVRVVDRNGNICPDDGIVHICNHESLEQ